MMPAANTPATPGTRLTLRAPESPFCANASDRTAGTVPIQNESGSLRGCAETQVALRDTLPGQPPSSAGGVGGCRPAIRAWPGLAPALRCSTLSAVMTGRETSGRADGPARSAAASRRCRKSPCPQAGLAAYSRPSTDWAPSTCNAAPLTNPAGSLHKKATTFPKSAGSPASRPPGAPPMAVSRSVA